MTCREVSNGGCEKAQGLALIKHKHTLRWMYPKGSSTYNDYPLQLSRIAFNILITSLAGRGSCTRTTSTCSD